MQGIQTVFIAVVVVMVALNIFMLFVVRSIAAIVGRQIRKETQKLFAAYEPLLVEKSKELRDLEQKLSEIQPQSILEVPETKQATMGPVAVVHSGGETHRNRAYRNPLFAEGYRSVQGRFTIEPETVIAKVADNKTIEEKKVAIAVWIVENISFDTVYRLSSLLSEMQWQVLWETMNAEIQPIFKALAGEKEAFQIVDFYHDMKTIYTYETGKMFVRTGGEKDDFTDMSDQVVTVLDPTICQGVQIVTGNKMYDFSIGKRDIG